MAAGSSHDGADPLGDSVPLTGDPRIDVVTQGGSWGFGAGPHVLTYSLNTTALGGAWTATQEAAVAQIFDAWAAVANVTFQRVDFGGDIRQSPADIAVGLSGSHLQEFGIVGIAGFPSATDGDLYLQDLSILYGAPQTRANYAAPEGDVYVDNGYVGFQYLNPGGEGFLILLHELGHALGLKHPHDDGANGRPTATDLGVPQYDNGMWTVMSYDATSSQLDIGHQATPMPLDILAIQEIYGANLSYRTGDDLYLLADDNVVKTIWDAGGVDTISAAQLGGGVAVDLHEGSFIHSGSYSTTAIAFNVTIENAVGSAGSYTLIGNAANNVLDGAVGADRLEGGLGDDTYLVDSAGDFVVESAGAGMDTVRSTIGLILSADVENLLLLGAAASGTGNVLDNMIVGNAVANKLDGAPATIRSMAAWAATVWSAERV
jgi:serralysin